MESGRNEAIPGLTLWSTCAEKIELHCAHRCHRLLGCGLSEEILLSTALPGLSVVWPPSELKVVSRGEQYLKPVTKRGSVLRLLPELEAFSSPS